MNDLSNALRDEELLNNNRHCCLQLKPIPAQALFVLVPLLFIGLSTSIFIWVVVRSFVFFVSVFFVSSLVLLFIVWNVINWRRKGAVLIFLDSFPDSDLRVAKDGQLVKVTGRFSTDFYITDMKSGARAMVKAGYGTKVTPLVSESILVNTSSKNRMLSPYLKKWLGERNISVEGRILRMEEGYVKEGSLVTVVGLLRRNNDVFMIVEPPELISTGCLWQKLLLPVEIDGLILRVPKTSSSAAVTATH
ncbi:hypothetical protein Syun_019874 [Stephania yunnanensis]|uniref:Uncharacterized protein n=1 Tax=Stephania yunnanensis TaxID=152371 RepID=A0AAP0NW91_9MAGN